MTSQSAPRRDEVFRDQAAKQLQEQRAQRDALDQQIANLQAQREAVSAGIERLEDLLAPSTRPVSEPRTPYIHECKPEQPLAAIDAAICVLRAADGPLHFSEITRRALDAGLWVSKALKPEDSMKGALNAHMRNAGEASAFHRVGPGTFALRDAEEDA